MLFQHFNDVQGR